MKKTIFTLITCAALFDGVSSVKAQKFEGTITYSITFDESMPAEQRQVMEGSELVNYIKGNKARTDMKMAFMTNITLVDNEKKVATSYSDMMGQKIKMVTKPGD